MSISSSDAVTAGMVVAPMAGMLWYFFRRWMERMDRIEAKIDEWNDFRVTVMSTMVTRDDHNAAISRVHQRLDEHIAHEQQLSRKIARLEGARGGMAGRGEKP